MAFQRAYGVRVMSSSPVNGPVKRRKFVPNSERPWKGNVWSLGAFEVELLDMGSHGWSAIVRQNGKPWISQVFPIRSRAKAFAEAVIGSELRSDKRTLVSATNKVSWRIRHLQKAITIKNGGFVEFDFAPIGSGRAESDGSWKAVIGCEVITGRDVTGKDGAIVMLTLLKRRLDEILVSVVSSMCKLKSMRSDP